MARSKVKVNLDGAARKARDFIYGLSSVKAQIAQQIIKQMRETILRGQSPVRDVGRFVQYKDPKVYPAKLKRRSPVNLKLKGNLLRAFDYRVESNKLRIGIFDEKERDKMIGLQRGGTNKVKFAGPRPVWPDSSKGQEFTVKIMRDFMRALKAMWKKTR